MQNKKSNVGTFFKILNTVKGKKRYLAALLIVQICLAASSVGYALFLRNIIDSAVVKSWDELYRNIIGLALLAITQLVLRLFVHFLSEFTKASIENSFKGKLFREILKKDYSAVTRIHSGEWLNRLTNDTVVVADGLTSIFPGVAATAIRMISAFVFLLYIVPKFTLFMLICGAALILFATFFRKISKKLHLAVQKADGDLRIFLTEQLSALMVLKAYGAEQRSTDSANDYMAEHKAKRMRKNHFSNLASSGFGFAMNAMQVLGALYCGAMILTGNITSYGTFTAVMQLMGQVQAPIANISGFMPRYYSMLASAERIFEVSDYSDDTAEATVNTKDFYDNDLTGFGLKNAAFSYNSGENDAKIVLNDINISIKKGEFVAFTGPSGCGKSTVLKLILSLYKLDDGELYLNTQNGTVPINSSYRGLFAYVPQGNILMNGTIREVVTFGDPNADESRLLKALEIACADTFLARLNDGIDTYLGERGLGLSEGEMQRIAIARAIYSGRPILLLDEATSALDEATEARLLTNLKTMTDKTVVVVTHRRAVVGVVDKTVEFSNKGVQTDD